MLMYFLDIAEVIKSRGGDANASGHPRQLDWPLMVRLAHEWGAVEVLGSVLQVCARLLEAPVPRWVLEALPVRGGGRVTRFVMARVADSEVAGHLGQPPSRFWKFLLVTNGAFILRPIRLLDLAGYIFPGGEYLRRRYGSDSLWTAGRHVARSLRQYARVGGDTVYFTYERYRRMKALGKSASLFNRLEEWQG
jgi:hypothetical protein